VNRTFFIVGPTATGKSELAADVARETDAEIVSAVGATPPAGRTRPVASQPLQIRSLL
jgi:Isopentenyl transferase